MTELINLDEGKLKEDGEYMKRLIATIVETVNTHINTTRAQTSDWQHAFDFAIKFITDKGLYEEYKKLRQ